MNARVRDRGGGRALVLGATGFVGRWTAAGLAQAGAEVHLGVRDRARADAIQRDHGFSARSWHVDLCEPGAATALIGEVAPDVVFNLAGYGVRAGERDEGLAQRLNVELVQELGEALSSPNRSPAATPVLVHTGTAAEYVRAGGDLREDGPALPLTVYGRTKLEGTRALERLAATRGLRVVVARLFTVYGPGEPEGRLLPTLLAAARTRAGADLSAGTQRRDFTYVEDVAEGLVRLARVAVPPGMVVNLATGRLLAVRDFVSQAAVVLGIAPAALRFGVLAPRDEMEHEPVNTERLVRLLDWRPSTSVAQGVRRTQDLLGRGAP